MVPMCYAKQSPTARTISPGAQPLPGATESLTRWSQSDCAGSSVATTISGDSLVPELFNSQLEEGDRSAASSSLVVEGGVQRKVLLNGEGMIQDRAFRPF